MEPSNAKRLRALEDENSKLKKLLAAQMMTVLLISMGLLEYIVLHFLPVSKSR